MFLCPETADLLQNLSVRFPFLKLDSNIIGQEKISVRIELVWKIRNAKISP